MTIGIQGSHAIQFFRIKVQPRRVFHVLHKASIASFHNANAIKHQYSIIDSPLNVLYNKSVSVGEFMNRMLYNSLILIQSPLIIKDLNCYLKGYLEYLHPESQYEVWLICQQYRAAATSEGKP